IPFTSLSGPWSSPVWDNSSPVLASSPSFSTRSPKPLSIPPSPSSNPPSDVFSLRFFIMWLISVDPNTVLLHFRMQRLVIHLEEACGLGFVSAGPPQGVDDRRPFHVDRVAADDFPQRAIAPPPAGRGGAHHFVGRQNFVPLRPQAEVLLGNDVFGDQDSAAGDRAKLPHISGPAVGQHRLDRRWGKTLDRFGKLDVGNIHEALRGYCQHRAFQIDQGFFPVGDRGG